MQILTQAEQYPQRAGPSGYDIHLVQSNGYGGGVVGAYPRGATPTGSNWHSALSWDQQGKLTNVDTKPEHQGKGLARALYEHVKQNYRPDLMHDHALSGPGKAFAQAVGGMAYDDDEYQRRWHQNEQERKLPWEQREQLMRNRGWPSSSAGVL